LDEDGLCSSLVEWLFLPGQPGLLAIRMTYTYAGLFGKPAPRLVHLPWPGATARTTHLVGPSGMPIGPRSVLFVRGPAFYGLASLAAVATIASVSVVAGLRLTGTPA